MGNDKNIWRNLKTNSFHMKNTVFSNEGLCVLFKSLKTLQQANKSAITVLIKIIFRFKSI